MNSPCIYAIRNTMTGKVYVGSASNFGGRKKCHLNRLRNDKHHSILLQRAWNKYGEAAFEFVILEAVADVADLVVREQHWIDERQSADPACGYNVAKVAGSPLGVRHGPETTAKRLATLAARSPEQKAATREKLAAARRGYRHTEETLAKMRGQKRTDEARARMSVANKGRPVTPEQRQRIAQTLRGRSRGPQSPETIAKRVAATAATKAAKRAAMP